MLPPAVHYLQEQPLQYGLALDDLSAARAALQIDVPLQRQHIRSSFNLCRGHAKEKSWVVVELCSIKSNIEERIRRWGWRECQKGAQAGAASWESQIHGWTWRYCDGETATATAWALSWGPSSPAGTSLTGCCCYKQPPWQTTAKHSLNNYGFK